ncbi:hypothetical protein BU16DRAFT_622487 [Lophium mytilinum]|uniref:C2H2-type domain-containing protein n=1 Tax=Lophium mytilinum TaxID=390894 RepID=A0A6A6QBP4_9PEZI|nr:hypothetical protein BU16DRAFT_622487 [Lophium mytilinum]
MNPRTKTSHSRTRTKALRQSKPRHHQSYIVRWSCEFPDCASTFSRVYDLIRHEKTIHGPKQRCIYPCCKYATARADKMDEHTHKIHLRGQETPLSSVSPIGDMTDTQRNSYTARPSPQQSISEALTPLYPSLSFLDSVTAVPPNIQYQEPFIYGTGARESTYSNSNMITELEPFGNLDLQSLRDYSFIESTSEQWGQKPVIYECWKCGEEANACTSTFYTFAT